MWYNPTLWGYTVKKRAFVYIFMLAFFISCGSQGENDNRIEQNNDAIGYDPVAEQPQKNSRPAPTTGIIVLDALDRYGILLEEAQVDWEEIQGRPEFRRMMLIQVAGNRYLFVPDESFFPWDNIAGIYSSSEAEERYGPENLLDQTWQSWAVGGGIGETFTVEFNAPVRLDRFWIRNGNGQLDRYFQNNRVKSFEVFLDDQEMGRTVNIRDTHELTSYGFPHLFMSGFYPRQVIMNGTYVTARRVTFKITELFYGTHYDTTFISEIFFGAPTLSGPPGRWGERWPLNRHPSFWQYFRSDPFMTRLIGALYESYGIPTRLNSDNQLEIYANPDWDGPTVWHPLTPSLTGEVRHMFFGGTGAGSAGHRYRIFLSPDFPPILVIFSWDTTSMAYWESELRSIQLFDGYEWVDHNNNPAILPILTLKEGIEERGLLAQFSFTEYGEHGNIVFGGQNSLVIQAVEIAQNDDGWPFRNVLETYRFLWNGEEFEPQ